MPSSSSERPSSPSPSVREGVLIRSFTTTSSTSADERIAAARAARERRQKEREGGAHHDDNDEYGEDAAAPLVKVDEASAPSTPTRTTTDGRSDPSLVPKLRVQSASDRSYTPSIPSTPSQSLHGDSSSIYTSSPLSTSTSATRTHDAPPPSSSTSAIPASSTGRASPSSRCSSFEVAQIPPFRPKSASPAPASAPPPPPSSSSSPTPPPAPTRTPSPGVTMSGGLMARLKAQRAAKATAEAKTSEVAEPSPAQTAAAAAAAEAVQAATGAKTVHEAASTSAVEPAWQSSTGDSSQLTSSDEHVEPSRPSAAIESVSESHAASTSLAALGEAQEGTQASKASDTIEASEMRDNVSELSMAPRPVSPPKGRRTQVSKVLGRNGEEYDFDFTELSDVQEQSERSSLSTWRDSVRQHRRQGSTSTIDYPPSASSSARPIFSSNPSRFSYASSTGRQQADGSFSSTFDRRAPLPPSASAKSFSSDPLGHTRSRSEGVTSAVNLEKRIAATSHILGRSGSSRSVFSGTSSSSQSSRSSAARSPPLVPGRRSASPTRRISPEVARRAAQFEAAGEGRRSSPVKADRVPLPLAPQKPSSSEGTAHAFSTAPPAIVPAPVAAPVAEPLAHESPVEPEDPLVGIERRRTQRRQALEAYKNKVDDLSRPLEGGGERRSLNEARRKEVPRSSLARPNYAHSGTPEAGDSAGEATKAEPSAASDLLRSSVRSSSSKSSEPDSPRAGPLCEGYLMVPPSYGVSVAESLARPHTWTSRYCVLTADSFDFRPTDQNPQPRVVAFRTAEAVRVEDNPALPADSALRPFAVILNDGDPLLFACESRVDKVRWVLALQQALDDARRIEEPANQEHGKPLSAYFNPASPSSGAPFRFFAESTRTVTPPGSLFSETRGTIRREKDDKIPPYSPPIGLYSYLDDKKTFRSYGPGSSASSADSDASSLFGHGDKRPRDLFDNYARPLRSALQPRPASIASSGSGRPLPQVPPKDATALPPLVSPTRSAFSHHQRSGSDLSQFNTPSHEPPFRPTPTRPALPAKKHSDLPFSPSSLLPARPSTRSSRASTPSAVPTDELEALQRDLRELMDEAEVEGNRRLYRDHRYRRVQERLRAFRTKHRDGSLSSKTETFSDEQASLAEKVDYLLQATTTLLEKQQQAASHANEDHHRRFEVEQEELAARLEARIEEMLGDRQVPQQAPASSSSIRTLRAAPAGDAASLTTRAGVHSASEKVEWQHDLKRYKEEAKAPASSVASPNTMRRERETASRRLEGLSPLPPKPVSALADDIPPTSFFGSMPSRSRDPFAGSGVVQPSAARVTPPQDGHAAPRMARPPSPHKEHVRPYSEWSAGHSVASSSWLGKEPAKVEQALWRILENFEQQNSSLDRNQQYQERISAVIGELAKWVAEDRHLRDNQFQDLIGAVNGVVQHVSDLPQRLLASLQNAEAAPSSPAPLPNIDLSDDIVEQHEALEVADAIAAAFEGEQPPANEIEQPSKRRMLGINPLSSFAQVDRKVAAAENGKGAGTVGGSRLKGPRMPGIRLWGAPVPVADRAARWGGTAAEAKAAQDKKDTADALAEDAEKAKGPNGPIVEAIKKDEGLGAALQAIAEGEGTEIDAGTLSLAVFEILQSMREMQKKQAEDEAKKAAEREKNGGLLLSEKAELEAKKAEIVRLEREMQMTAERTAKINELVAQLANRTDKADAMLAQIAQNVKEGKRTTMDPALSEEVKKLLGGVRSGVDDHVKDFRGQLTSEVQRMFKEVGKLRDEKKTLQADIAELMAFQAKHGGAMPKAAPPAAAPPPAAAADPPAKPGMPSSGFFGPRPMP